MSEYNTENGQDYTENQEYSGEGNFDHQGEGDNTAGQDRKPSGDEDERKLFVGGLSWETTVKDLREYFSKFGEVVDCTLKTDPNTGRSRGFGFVTFSDVSAVDAVIEQSSHKLHERQIDPKRAKARGKPEPIKKVFVGGLDPSTSEQDIRDYFGQYGKVLELDLPFDKMKGQRRAFCFVTFESEDIVEEVVKKPIQNLGGKEVDVKKATPRQDQGWGNQGWGNQGWGGHRGGRGGYEGRGRGGGYGGNYGNYDYNQYGYGNYDYNNYYNQGWGNYNQGYGSNYGNDTQSPAKGYDYSGWYGNQQGNQQDY